MSASESGRSNGSKPFRRKLAVLILAWAIASLTSAIPARADSGRAYLDAIEIGGKARMISLPGLKTIPEMKKVVSGE